MSLSFSQKAAGAWALVTGRYDHRIDTDLERWQGRLFLTLYDHGWLRRAWRNEGRIAEGLYRANQPDATRLAEWKARGIVDVLSLRPARGIVQAFETEACDALGLRLLNAPLPTRVPPQARSLLRLIDQFDALRRPALIHCKSGADRTGLAAAIWAIHVEGKSVQEARRALSLRHLHLKWSKTGVLDRVLDLYEDRIEAQGPIAIRDWIATEYDSAALL